MTFEFLISYHKSEATVIETVLAEALAKVLEDNLNEYEPEVVEGMIQTRHERTGDESTSEDGGTLTHMLLGFMLDLPDETEQVETVVIEFAVALSEMPPIFHCVKFEDPLLRTELAGYAETIFGVEMKLRRVLTLIYLHANQSTNFPYDLLRDEAVQPMSKEKVKVELMRAAAENQFFHLTFGQYVGLNERPEVKLPALLSLLRDASTYEEFRLELDRSPIKQEDDAILVAGLKERMDAIETMRNCVAHNRKPTKRVTENFLNALPLLEEMLNEYLARWESTPQP